MCDINDNCIFARCSICVTDKCIMIIFLSCLLHSYHLFDIDNCVVILCCVIDNCIIVTLSMCVCLLNFCHTFHVCDTDHC